MINFLYLDSSGYSVHTGKANTTLSEYNKYISRYGHLFDQVFLLDDDFNDPERNLNNQMFLESKMSEKARRPIPVIHDVSDPFREFQMYVDMGHDYIAVGSNRQIDDDTFAKIREEYPDVKLHMFGNLNREMLFKHKPYSVDSATWAHAAGYGNIYYWDPEDKKDYRIYVGEKERKDKKIIHYNDFHHKKELDEFLHKTFGYTYTDLLKGKEDQYIVNMFFFHELERVINEMEKEEETQKLEP